ncbi:MAG: hypothetical protein PHP26_03575 [Syntrophomonas sp.]|nr:hypothetical protein [Syntrophomonas sp.]
MSEFVKKTVIGYKEVPGGNSDPECTHVILTKKEYEKLVRDEADAERRAIVAKSDADKEIGRAKSEARYEAENAAEKARKKVEDIAAELEKEKAESAYQRRLNANLLRISKERANAERKLKPKKEHTGYVVTASEEKEYSYRDGNRRWSKVKLWETVLQSPYGVDYTEEQARKLTQEDLFPSEDEWLIAKIGITARYGGAYDDMRDDRNLSDEFRKSNILLDRQKRLRANFRAGYWEMVFMHTKPLGIVPADMRAC